MAAQENGENILELPTESSKVILNQIFKEHFKHENYTIDLKPGAKKGDNYLGIVFRAIATDNTNGQNLHLIAKLAPQNPARREQFFAKSSFARESLFYNKILRLLMDFQIKKGIDVYADGFHEVPECLQASLIDCEESIFMKDLKVLGFEMYDRHADITFEHCRLVLESLGKLHAISFAMKDQEPETFAPNKNILDLFYEREESEMLDKFFQVILERAIGTLDPVEDADIVERARAKMGKSFKTLIQSMTHPNACGDEYAVLCHGDCWNNNILFKNENGKPVDLRLLDWQIMRYATPITDIAYFIFTITSEKFRKEHYKTLLNIYYKSLSDFIRKLGSDPDVLYPEAIFHEHLIKFGNFGLFMCMMLLPILTTKAEDVPNLDEMAEKMAEQDESSMNDAFNSKNSEDVYKSKMSSVLRDMYNYGYI